MADREKVIEGLEAMREFFGFGLPSQSPVFEAYQRILTDVLALLKEHEVKMSVCDNCGLEHPADDRYCPRCGKSNFD